MARSIAEGPVAPRGLATRSLAQAAVAVPEEAKERAVAAEPRLDRSAFLYMEPRPGIDGAGSFAQCAACQHFVPEAMMRGAVRGDRCSLFGSTFPITDDDSCGLFAPNPDGRPCEHCEVHAAEEMISGMRASASPYQVGYVSDQKVRCMNCRQFDAENSECEFFGELNEKLPALFACDEKVKADGCCNAWAAYPAENI